MKEMIQELKKYLIDFQGGGLLIGHFLPHMARALIAVMERMEAMDPPAPRVAWVESVAAAGRALTQVDIDRARRDGRIEALRWAWRNATCSHTLCSSTRIINDAITRIERGDEL